MYKKFLSAALMSSLFCTSLSAAEKTVTGVVNFTTCITDSKHGKKEQENLESLRKQMTSLIENTEKELKEIAAKLEDSEYMDGLSPKAEEELKTKFQALQEDMGRYQQQFYQVLNHANYQMMQKVNTSIATAAKEVAEKNKLDYVINKEACFYSRSDLDVTPQVISAMDKKYDADLKDKKITENEEVNVLSEINKAQAG